MASRGKYEKYHKNLEICNDFGKKALHFVYQNLDILTRFPNKWHKLSSLASRSCWSSCWLPPPSLWKAWLGKVSLRWKSVGFLKLKYEQEYLCEMGMNLFFFHRFLWQRQLGIWSDGV